ncbi:MAG: extracellular solute-binding protein [Deltaproteobacteria bacterium]|nr:extracellular solute-binding protein [Deltaproteobacteria bacterium]
MRFFVAFWFIFSPLLVSLVEAGQPQSIIEGAKKDGRLIWWGGGTEAEDREFIKRFNQTYPFIKVEQWNTSSKATQERVWAEFIAKKYSWDVVTGGGRSALDWVKAGMLQKWSVPGLANLPAAAKDPNGYYAAFGFNVSVPIYNTNLISPNEAPKSWEDLLNPKWKGKIAVPDLLDIWVALAQPGVWGKEKVKNYVTKLAANQPKILSYTTGLTLVVAGDLHISTEAFLFRTMVNKDKGASIDFVRVNPVIGKGPRSFLSKNPPHPNAALVWLDWVYSPEGEKAIDEILNKGNPSPESNTRQAKLVKGLRYVHGDDDFYVANKDFHQELKNLFGIK